MAMTTDVLKRIPGVVVSLLVLFLTGCDNDNTSEVADTTDTSAGKTLCPLGEAVETDGIRRLALIIGVGEYKKEGIPDLIGPPNDADRIFDLLTADDGYGFPKANVCLLLNEHATLAEVRHAFDQALVARARPQDVAVVYYAGHGSQRDDVNHDEPDAKDETLVLHDSRSDGVPDLVDDEFHAMLASLYAKTQNITVILDSCNSGTVTRGADSTFIARLIPEDETARSSDEAPAQGLGDAGAGWVPEAMPGLIALTAAADSTPAMETGGRGIFTDAIIQVLGQASDEPITFAQVARQVPPLVAARSYQIPYFHGDLNTPVFSNEGRTRPLAWEIRSVGPPLELSGPPLPGVGEGTEMRIYDGATRGDTTRDPGRAKATVVIDDMKGLNATARILTAQAGTEPLAAGDLAVMVRPEDAYRRIKVRLRPPAEVGGIATERAVSLRAAIEDNREASMLVELTEGAGDFELSVDVDQQLVLRGPENNIRNVYQQDDLVADSLWQHARQRALLQLQGEGGAEFSDNQTLQVQLVPAEEQSPCADGIWEQAPANAKQVIPLCHAWNVKVALDPDARLPLQVGGVVLASDGNSYGIPADGRKVLLHPGEEVVFRGRLETFVGTPPLDIQEHLMVFGTQEENPVQWHLLTSTAATRAAGPPMTGLYGALDRYLRPGPATRTAPFQEENTEITTWTLTTISFRVEANPRFLQPSAGVIGPPTKREYTIANFDIRPYLPDDTETDLYSVLLQADLLARASATDGYGYKQHDWALPTDSENLMRGIDCSRAIWYAFTRAGLPYNSDNLYLSTAMMVDENSEMSEMFDDCSQEPLQLGDVIVYRDETRGDGHVVLVIDPQERIAWGSHGWDGNAKVLKIKPDTGVEYQLIKYKQDWARWDRSTMTRKACWRYRTFSAELATRRDQIGMRALKSVCDFRNRCGQF